MNHSLNKRALEGLAVLLILLLICPPHLRGSINIQDEGVWLSAIQSLLQGRTLYRDIWFQYGPLLLLPLKFTLSLFGTTLATVRLTYWSLNIFGLICIYGALIRFVEQVRIRFIFFVLLVLATSAAHTPFIPFSGRYGIGFLSFVFWPVGGFNDSEKKGNPLVSGLLASLAFWVSQEVGLSAFAAGVFVFWEKRDFFRSMRMFILGFAIPMAISLGLLALHGSLRSYVQCAFLDIGRLVVVRQQHAAQMDFALWSRAAHGVVSWLTPWQNLAEVFATYLPVLFYGLVAVEAWWFSSFKKMFGREGMGMLVFGAGLALVAWARSDRFHVYFALRPLFFLGALLTDRLNKIHPRAGSISLLMGIVLGGLMTLPHFLAWQMKNKLLRDTVKSLDLPRAGSVQLPVNQANGYEFLAQWLDKNSRAGDPLLFFPYNGAVYFLTNRLNACRFPILADAQSQRHQQEAIEDFIQTKPQWVIYDEDNTAFDGTPVQIFLKDIFTYIQAHYKIQETHGPFIFMRLQD